MYDIVEQIRYDHISISRILFIMEREVRRINDEVGPDYSLLVECMRYMVEYTDLVHHPKEDTMMRCISKKSSKLNELVQEIKMQHKSIGKFSIDFYEMVKAAELDEFVEKKKISEMGLRYINMQREHINLEEGSLLKNVRGLLLNDDYIQINRQYESYRDPQLSDSFETEYSALYQSLVC